MSAPAAPVAYSAKPWWGSRTLWLNALALLLACLAAAEPVLPALQGLLPARLYAALAFVLPVLNAALRFITTRPLALAAPPAASAAPPGGAQAGFVWLQFLLVLGAIFSALVIAWLSGWSASQARWLAKDAERVQAQAQAQERQSGIAQSAADGYARASAAQAAQYQQLQGALHHARKQFSLTLAAASASQCAASAPAPPPLALADAAPAPADAEPGLTLGAVWLWNAALGGSAAAPAGACSVDAATGQAAAACAQASGLTLEHAFANHAANAALCAADRLRQQRLIDYLHSATQASALPPAVPNPF